MSSSKKLFFCAFIALHRVKTGRIIMERERETENERRLRDALNLKVRSFLLLLLQSVCERVLMGDYHTAVTRTAIVNRTVTNANDSFFYSN